MVEARVEYLDSDRIQRVVLYHGENPISYGETLEMWQRNEEFRKFFIALLADAPFSAYRWETPPVAKSTLDRIFEFVLLDSPWLDEKADPSAFSSFFAAEKSDAGISGFPNLGNDAFLVAPCPRGPLSAYGHVAVFSREAPKSQNQALWRTVGFSMKQHLGDSPIWLNTAGGGVPWLHVRLDSRPKYYGFQPYKKDQKRLAAPPTVFTSR